MSNGFYGFDQQGAGRVIRATKFVESRAKFSELNGSGIGQPSAPVRMQLSGVLTIGGTTTLDSGVYQAAMKFAPIGSLTLTGGTLTAGSLTADAGVSCYFVHIPEISAGTHVLQADTTSSATLVIAAYAGLASDGNPVYVSTDSPAVLQTFGTLSGYLGAGPVDFSPYWFNLINGGTLTAKQWFEPGNGSPGPTGLTVATTGTLTGTSCVEKPLGNGTRATLLSYNPKEGWVFGAPNSFS